MMAHSERVFPLVALVLILCAPTAWADTPEPLHGESGEISGIDVGLLFIDLVGWESTGPGDHRLQVLDAPLLTGALHVSSGETSETHVFDFPLIRAVEVDVTEPTDKEVRVLQAPFTTIWRNDRHGSHRSWELVDLSLVNAVEHESSPDSWSWSLIDGPILTGFHAERSPELAKGELVGIDPLSLSLLKGRNDADGRRWSLLECDGIVPFTLLGSHRGREGSHDITIIDPPVLRPFFRHRQAGNWTEMDFLFVFHTEYER